MAASSREHQKLLNGRLKRLRYERLEVESRLSSPDLVRAFVERITIDGASQSGEVRIKKLPVPELPNTGSSFDLVAGVRYKAIYDAMGERLVARWLLPKNGRRPLGRAGSGASRGLCAVMWPREPRRRCEVSSRGSEEVDGVLAARPYWQYLGP